MSAERAYDPIVRAESAMVLWTATGTPRLAAQYLPSD